MKQQIRRLVFETNSSSTHSMTITTAGEYQQWKDGLSYYSIADDELVDVEMVLEWYKDCDICTVGDKFDEKRRTNGYYTYREWYSYAYSDYELFTREFTTPSKDAMVAFGYYDYQG